MKLPIFFLTMFLSFQSIGYSENETSTITLNRPQSERDKLNSHMEKGFRQGMHFQDWIFSNDFIKMTMPAAKGWQNAPTSSSESLALSLGRATKSPHLSFSLFKKGEFLKDNSHASLQAYVDLLKKEFPGRIEILNEKENFTVKHTFFILGATYKVVTFLVKEPDQSMRYLSDFIVFPMHDKYSLLIIRFDAPLGVQEELLPALNQSLRFSEIIEPEDQG